MSNQDQKLDALLNAYVDGQLDEDMRKKYAAYLDAHPDMKIEATQFDELNSQIKSAFGDDLEIPTSDRLQRFVEMYPDPESKTIEPPGVGSVSTWDRLRQYFNVPHMVIYASLVIASLSLTYLLPQGLPYNPLRAPAFSVKIEQLALDAHQIYSAEKRHAVEVPASDKAHLMKWLSKRLSAEVGPAELDDFGYKLIGGRLLPSAGKHAALYMYADKSDRRLTLYIRQNEGSQNLASPECKLDNSQASICTWQGEKMLYLLIGPPGNVNHSAISIQTARQLKQ